MSPAKVPGFATPIEACTGEAAHVQLVNDAVDQRNVEWLIVLPVESSILDHATRCGKAVVLAVCAPHAPPPGKHRA